MFIGALFQKIRLPGLVRPFRFYDGDSGQLIEIKTTPFYTKLIVGNTEFFFVRETGKYDGFGQMSTDECTSIDHSGG